MRQPRIKQCTPEISQISLLFISRIRTAQTGQAGHSGQGELRGGEGILSQACRQKWHMGGALSEGLHGNARSKSTW